MSQQKSVISFYKKWGLCISILILAVGITFALKAQQKPEEKKYKVELSIPEWEKRISQLQWVQQQIKQSDIPSRNSIFATDSILTPLVQQIFYQINTQVKYEQSIKNTIKDSTTTKTKKN